VTTTAQATSPIETSAQRAAAVRALADSGLPMPSDIAFGHSMKLGFTSYTDFTVWSEQLFQRHVFDDRSPSKKDPARLVSWHVGVWGGVEVSLWAHEDAPAQGGER